jgi:hypothetical protein
MDMIDRQRPEHRPYIAEIYIHGLLYLRIERLPQRLAVLLATTLPLIITWLLTR